jgi:hypothetical protein
MAIAKEPIGGWLILPAFGTWLSPFRQVFDLAWSAGDYQQIFDRGDTSLRAFAVAEIAAVVFFAAAWTYCIVLLVRRSPSYPVLFNGLLITMPVWSAANLTAFTILFGGTVTVQEMKPVIQGIVVAAIWIPYMLVSKRVRRTFGHGQLQAA